MKVHGSDYYTTQGAVPTTFHHFLNRRFSNGRLNANYLFNQKQNSLYDPTTGITWNMNGTMSNKKGRQVHGILKIILIHGISQLFLITKMHLLNLRLQKNLVLLQPIQVNLVLVHLLLTNRKRRQHQKLLHLIPGLIRVEEYGIITEYLKQMQQMLTGLEILVKWTTIYHSTKIQLVT